MMNPMCIPFSDCDYYQQEYFDVRNLPVSCQDKQSYNKSNANRQFNNPCNTTNGKLNRPVSQRRRFFSVENNKQPVDGTHQIIQCNQSGWYQTNYNTRNQSLESRLAVDKPLITYNESDIRVRKRRRYHKNRHGSHRLYMSHNNRRFLSPNPLVTPLGLMKELPFSRIHDATFHRLFPTMMKKVMRDRKERRQAAKELPYANYPDNKLQDLFSISQPSNDTTVKDPRTTSPWKWGQMKQEYMIHSKGYLLKEDNVMNEEHETEKCTNIRERDDSEQFTSKYEYPDRNNYRTMATPILEEFLTPGETEEKQHSNYSDENEPENSVFKVSEKLEETLSFSHINQEIKQNSKKIHLSVDNEVSHSDGFASHLPNNKDIHCCEYQEQATCESWRTDPCTESQTKSYLDEQRFSKLHKPSPILEQKDILSDYHPEPQTDATIPPPQATASLFQSASGGQLTGLLTCKACSQPAYLAERFEADGTVYHTSCFKCYSCLCMLQRGTWNQRGSKYYCNPCHRRIALQTLRH